MNLPDELPSQALPVSTHQAQPPGRLHAHRAATEDEQEEITKALTQVDEILDVRQRARFRILEEQLERWKLDLLSRVRRPNAGPGAKVRPPKS